MNRAAPAPSVRRRQLFITAFVVAAAFLFVWSVHSAGAAAVVDAVRQVGLWFGVVVLLGGVRYLARAAAWRLCLERRSALPLSSAFAATVAGNAIGNVSALGALAGEPSKVLLLYAGPSTLEAGAALAVENLCYISSVFVAVAAGAALLPVAFGPSVLVMGIVAATIAGGLAAIGLAAAVLLRRVRIVSGLAQRLAASRWLGRRFVRRLPQLYTIESKVFGGLQTVRRRLLPIATLEASFHAAAVAEIAIVVAAMIGTRPPIVIAVILEMVNRITTVAFQFVPLWLGVDEALSGTAAQLLRVGAPIGVGLAVVRKGRILCWTAIGLSIAAVRGRSMPEAHHEQV